MGEEKPERPYPLRTIHDFLSELDREWDKFRVGSLIGMVASGVLLVFLLPRVFRAMRPWKVFDLAFMVLATAFLIYSIYALLAQYRFFKRWERRVWLLIHLEEELMGEKPEKETSN